MHYGEIISVRSHVSTLNYSADFGEILYCDLKISVLLPHTFMAVCFENFVFVNTLEMFMGSPEIFSQDANEVKMTTYVHLTFTYRRLIPNVPRI
jgi:hypothetical protein